jgi:hypothetical protein
LSGPNIDAVKARVRKQQEEAAAAEAAPKVTQPKAKLKTSPEEMERFMKDFSEANAPEPERVDLGELSAEVKDNHANFEDGVTYRGTVIDNPKTRALIESRCADMDFGDLILSGRVCQDVPILKGKLEPSYQSLLGKEIFWLERNAHIHASSNLAMASWMGYARAALSMTAVNGKQFESHIDKDGELIDERVTEKITNLLNLPEQFISMLLVNYTWFNVRVEALYKDDFDLLKNG